MSAHAQADVAEILGWAEVNFGEAARDRYERLLVDGFHDLQNDADRIGFNVVDEAAGVRSWHLGMSNGPSGVKRPRHLVIYQVEGQRVLVGRVLHERMEFGRHLNPGIWD